MGDPFACFARRLKRKAGKGNMELGGAVVRFADEAVTSEVMLRNAFFCAGEHQ